MAIVVGVSSMLVPDYALFIILSIGLTQLPWIVPLATITLFFRRTRFAGRGLIEGALLIVLGQSACYGIFCGGAMYGSGEPVELKAPPDTDSTLPI
jgi:hypothetical protein